MTGIFVSGLHSAKGTPSDGKRFLVPTTFRFFVLKNYYPSTEPSRGVFWVNSILKAIRAISVSMSFVREANLFRGKKIIRRILPEFFPLSHRFKAFLSVRNAVVLGEHVI